MIFAEFDVIAAYLHAVTLLRFFISIISFMS